MNPQVWIGDDRPTPDRMDPIQNTGNVKPNGGLWTSTLTCEDPVTSAWIEWCHREQFWSDSDPEAWILYPDSDADVYRIENCVDLRALFAEYGYQTVPGFDLLDYEAIARTYDGIHLTEEGQAATRFTPPRDPDLYGWDCESTLWFTWAFTDVEACGSIRTESPSF